MRRFPDMFLPKLLRELSAIRLRIEELCNVTQELLEATCATRKGKQEDHKSAQPVPVVISLEEQAAKDAGRRDERQYRTQEKIKKWTALAVVAASIYAFVAAFQWYQMKKSTDAAIASADSARRAAKTAQRQLELSERPWVAVLDAAIRSSLVFDDKGAHTEVSFVLKNTGHSPALSVSISPELTTVCTNCPKPVYVEERACKDAKHSSKFVSYTIFPGETFVERDQGHDMKMSEAEIERGFGISGTHTIIPAVIGCVDYKTPFSSEIHHTGFAFVLMARNQNIIAGQDVFRSKMKLVAWFPTIAD